MYDYAIICLVTDRDFIDVAAIEIHSYNAYSRLIAIPSRPTVVTFAPVLVVFNDTRAVIATITGTSGNAIDSKVRPAIRHKIVATNAMIRADAIAILTASFADRLAEAFVPQGETRVTRATIRRCTRAVGTFLNTMGYAVTVIV